MVRQVFLLWVMAWQSMDPSAGEQARGPRTLNSGWYPWDPYQYELKNPDGKLLTGLDIELVRTVLNRVHYDVAYDEVSWVQHLNDLRDGRRDIAVGFRRPDRDAFVAYSDAYRTETNVLYLRRGESGHWPGQTVPELLAAMKGRFRLGVIDGYAYGPAALQTFLADPDNKPFIVPAYDDSENFRNLFSGRIDGFLTDRTVGATLAWRNGWQQRVEEHGLILNREQIHVLFSLASTTPEDVAAFNRGLADLRAEGSYDQILASYLFPIMLAFTVEKSWFLAIDLLGTIAFAISGLVLARRGRYSIFGALVLAALPAVGGGVIRDLLIGREPIGLLRTPLYMLIILGAVGFGYLFDRLYRHWRTTHHYSTIVLGATRVVEVFDALGLAAFTITGVVIAVESQLHPLWLWGPLMAALTGAGGGIMRDVVRADVNNPNLKRTFYPEIAVIWGLILSLFLMWQNQRFEQYEIFLGVVGTLLGTFLTRILAIFFKWRSPLF